MNITLIKSNIKKSLVKNAKKMISKEVQQELGLFEKHAEIPHEEVQTDLGTFWSPVKSNMMSQQEAKPIINWTIGIVIALVFILVTVLGFLVMPKSKKVAKVQDTIVVVNGSEVNKTPEEQLGINNIEVSKDDEVEKVASNSPLLKPQDSGSITEYKVTSGDTLEVIAMKVYGSRTPDKIDKIKVANSIRNPRSLQIGQKLIIPF